MDQLLASEEASQAAGTKQQHSDISIPASSNETNDTHQTNDRNENQNCNQHGQKTDIKAKIEIGSRDDDKENKESVDDGDKTKNNESSTLSTAFTVSFDDDDTNNSKSSSMKRFGIRDSIRKFAPPKPHTIEKPREPKNRNGEDHGQDNSLVSIESAPANMSSKHSSPSHHNNHHNQQQQQFHHRDRSNSSRASSKKSNSSRQSNISDSAAFLIDKMLNQNNEIKSSVKSTPSKSSPRDSDNKTARQSRSLQYPQGGPGDKNLKSNMMESEVDFWEDKSDNGTYIVGADPESEAARKKIDELFGVYKAAEASLLAKKGGTDGQKLSQVGGERNSARQSRPTDKKPMTRERMEHINRLAYRKSPQSRSSSSSRHETQPPESRRHANNHSRNSSCDRKSGPVTYGSKSHAAQVSSTASSDRNNYTTSRPRRSASQSSRQSSHKEISDGDTRSSRSSLQNIELEVASNHQDQSSGLSSHPSMKFNRAFALRRARLGLGEPPVSTRLTSTPNYPQVPSSSSNRTSNNSTIPGSFSRDDGGRFSLRMRSNVLPSSSCRSSGRVAHHQASSNLSGGQLVDSYIGRLSSRPNATHSASALQQSASTSSMTTTSNNNQYSYQPATTTSNSNSNNNSSSNTPTSLPYQLGPDDLSSLQIGPDGQTMSPTRQRMLAARLARRGNENSFGNTKRRAASDLMDDTTDRINFSLGANNLAGADTSTDLYNNFTAMMSMDSRNSSRASGRYRTTGGVGSNTNSVQLGPLDSLVISAISCLSLKIRHSICDVLVVQAKKLPAENETRLIVEEILPQLTADSSRCKSPTSMEEIDQSLYFDLAKTLRNLKKVEQMVDVINLISRDTTTTATSTTTTTTATNIGGSPPASSQSSNHFDLTASEQATTTQ